MNKEQLATNQDEIENQDQNHEKKCTANSLGLPDNSYMQAMLKRGSQGILNINAHALYDLFSTIGNLNSIDIIGGSELPNIKKKPSISIENASCKQTNEISVKAPKKYNKILDKANNKLRANYPFNLKSNEIINENL